MRSGRVAVLAVAVASLGSPIVTGTAAAETPAAASGNPYSLEATALLGKAGLTDVYLKATSSDPAYPVPASFKEVQLKSFDSAGELVYARNFANVGAPGGVADLQRTDLSRGQRIQVQALVQTPETANTIVLDSSATVKRRPDLRFASVQAPAQVTAGTPFTVAAQVQELNGEVGATATLAVLDGEEKLDEVESISVPAGGTRGALFALKLDKPGTYTLTAAISNVNPGEWDTSNDTATFTVEVVEPKTMFYGAGYASSSYADHWDYFEPGSSSPFFSAAYESSWEFLNSVYWTNEQIDPAGTLDFTVAADGEPAESVHLDGVQLEGSCFSGHESAWNFSVMLCSSPYGSTVYAWQTAGHYRFSENYANYYSFSEEQNSGRFLDARHSLEAKLDLPDSGGARYGGGYTLPLSGSSYSWSYDQGLWGGYSIHRWGSSATVYGFGSGRTTW